MKVRIRILVTLGTILVAAGAKAVQMAADYLKTPEGRVALNTFLKHAGSFLSVKSNREALKKSAIDTYEDIGLGNSYYTRDGWEIEE